MHQSDFHNLMEKWRFLKKGEIVIGADSRLSFSLKEQCFDCGYVYLWVEVGESDHVVRYVGKAGGTLEARCRQHEGGFAGGSKTGVGHADRLRKGLVTSRRYLVFGRKSDSGTIADQAGICMSSVEELAFILKFQEAFGKDALWNFAKSRSQKPNQSRIGVD